MKGFSRGASQASASHSYGAVGNTKSYGTRYTPGKKDTVHPKVTTEIREVPLAVEEIYDERVLKHKPNRVDSLKLARTSYTKDQHSPVEDDLKGDFRKGCPITLEISGIGSQDPGASDVLSWTRPTLKLQVANQPSEPHGKIAIPAKATKSEPWKQPAKDLRVVESPQTEEPMKVWQIKKAFEPSKPARNAQDSGPAAYKRPSYGGKLPSQGQNAAQIKQSFEGPSNPGTKPGRPSKPIPVKRTNVTAKPVVPASKPSSDKHTSSGNTSKQIHDVEVKSNDQEAVSWKRPTIQVKSSGPPFKKENPAKVMPVKGNPKEQAVVQDVEGKGSTVTAPAFMLKQSDFNKEPQESSRPVLMLKQSDFSSKEQPRGQSSSFKNRPLPEIPVQRPLPEIPVQRSHETVVPAHQDNRTQVWQSAPSKDGYGQRSQVDYIRHVDPTQQQRTPETGTRGSESLCWERPTLVLKPSEPQITATVTDAALPDVYLSVGNKDETVTWQRPTINVQPSSQTGVPQQYMPRDRQWDDGNIAEARGCDMPQNKQEDTPQIRKDNPQARLCDPQPNRQQDMSQDRQWDKPLDWQQDMSASNQCDIPPTQQRDTRGLHVRPNDFSNEDADNLANMNLESRLEACMVDKQSLSEVNESSIFPNQPPDGSSLLQRAVNAPVQPAEPLLYDKDIVHTTHDDSDFSDYQDLRNVRVNKPFHRKDSIIKILPETLHFARTLSIESDKKVKVQIVCFLG